MLHGVHVAPEIAHCCWPGCRTVLCSPRARNRVEAELLRDTPDDAPDDAPRRM